MEIGKHITELRERQGYTTNKLATVAGVSQSYLRDVELGNKNPTVEMLSYICDALRVSLKEFFDVDEEYEIEPRLKCAITKLTPQEQLKLAEFILLVKD